jgi:hypothetical protein
MKKEENGKKSRLSLEDFKLKSNLQDSKEALDAITGGILAACHDGTKTPPSCTGSYTQTGNQN